MEKRFALFAFSGRTMIGILSTDGWAKNIDRDEWGEVQILSMTHEQAKAQLDAAEAYSFDGDVIFEMLEIVQSPV